MGRIWVLPCTALVAAILLVVIVPVGQSSASSPATVFSTDFEGVGFFITAWEPIGWSRGDYAAGHVDDLWCRANSSWLGILSTGSGINITAHSTQSALYCAKLGTNSNNGADNLVNGYPDPGMDSWVRLTPSNAASYDGMTLTFWYWAKTQDASYTGDLTDYLCVNANNGATTTMVWKQPSADSNGWQMATVSLPAGTVWMEWEFKSSSSSSGHYPGALIDDVTVTTGSVVSASPFSKIGSMSAYYSSRTVQVPATWTNADHLSLYYRTGNGGWNLYTDNGHPDGLFGSAPITFMAPSDGQYQIFTIAGNSAHGETMKAVADASIVVDATPPTLAITSPVGGTVHNESTLSLNWAATDHGSGIARTEVSVDDGAWIRVQGASRSLSGLTAGTHTAKVRATDNAGNSEEGSVTFIVAPGAPAMSVSPIGPGALLNSTVVVSFNETVTHASVHISVNGVPATLSWNGEVATSTSPSLDPGQTYTVNVTGTKVGGQAFSVEWSFTTVNDMGSISGTVRDQGGNAISNATVALSNGDVMITDAGGHFKFTALAPGNYTMTITAQGFVVRTMAVNVTAGQVQEMGDLKIDAVTADAPNGGLDPIVLPLVALLGIGAIALVAIWKGRKRH
ncbi:MAG: carboxypeptidase regulatory-like domain-containing protein [Methanomassiliicoccus sp.]|nr:carboxypeptidase regulatory-like domain-containing protein [Methanomassiliicoccus sp.]